MTRHLPAALSYDSLDDAAIEAGHINVLANAALAAGSFPNGCQTAAILAVIADMAEILSWNLQRLEGQGRAGR